MTALPALQASPDAARLRHRVGRRLAGVAIAGAALLAAGYFARDWWRHGRFVETTDDAYVGGDVTAISPHVAGFVTDILVADNAHVTAGALLARIDARDYQAMYDRAAAAVAAQTAALRMLRAQRVVQLAAIGQSAGELAAKDARAAFTRLDGARYVTLSLTRAGSIQDAERARTADREAQATMAASRAALAAARAQLDVIDWQTQQADAAIAQGQADLRRARLDLGYTEIRAPADGFIANRAVRTGSYVAAGAYLLSVVPSGGLWVDANYKEDQLAAMRPGQRATLVADAAPGVVFHGHLSSLAPGTGAVFAIIPPENATGNFTKIVQRVPVRIVLDPSDAALGRLRPGLSVTASIDTRDAP